MTHTYKTAQVAQIFGIHPNTVRMYEDYELIPKAERLPNGYRCFTDFHIAQIRLARTAFQIEILQNGLRKKVIDIVKMSAKKDFHNAITFTKDYIRQIIEEQKHAEEAIRITKQLISGAPASEEKELTLTRMQTAEYLQITTDTLRNWELNGLLTVKRKQNGYRIYTNDDLNQLKIIKSLRCANYSLSAILRMLHIISQNPQANIRAAIDSSSSEDDIITACDNLLTSLNDAKINANKILGLLVEMKNEFS